MPYTGPAEGARPLEHGQSTGLSRPLAPRQWRLDHDPQPAPAESTSRQQAIRSDAPASFQRPGAWARMAALPVSQLEKLAAGTVEPAISRASSAANAPQGLQFRSHFSHHFAIQTR